MVGKPKRIGTTIKIDPEVLKKAKIFAIQSGTTLSELVEKALKNELLTKSFLKGRKSG